MALSCFRKIHRAFGGAGHCGLVDIEGRDLTAQHGIVQLAVLVDADGIRRHLTEGPGAAALRALASFGTASPCFLAATMSVRRRAAARR